MRKLDWALAALIAVFLIGALTVETSAGLTSRIGGMRFGGFAPSAVSLRRLVSGLPAPILPGEPR